MAVDPVRGAVSRLPPLPELVQPTAGSTDPGQSVETDEKGRLRIQGVAAGKPGAGSAITLAFDGLTVSVSLRAGCSPRQTQLLLERVMPPGYRIALAAQQGDTCVLEVIRRPRHRATADRVTADRVTAEVPSVSAAPANREEPKLRTALQTITDAFAS